MQQALTNLVLSVPPYFGMVIPPGAQRRERAPQNDTFGKVLRQVLQLTIQVDHIQPIEFACQLRGRFEMNRDEP